MLLKFSNILAFVVATRHLEVRHVSNLARKHIVSGPWGVHFLATCNVRSDTGAEAKFRGRLLEVLRLVGILTWSWNKLYALGEIGFEFETHGERSSLLFRERRVWLVGAAAWNSKCLLILQLDAHMELFLSIKVLRCNVVVGGSWDGLGVPIVEHFSLLRSEAVLWRL